MIRTVSGLRRQLRWPNMTLRRILGQESSSSRRWTRVIVAHEWFRSSDLLCKQRTLWRGFARRLVARALPEPLTLRDFAFPRDLPETWIHQMTYGT